MAVYDHPVSTLEGDPADLRDWADQAILVVNVASKCGFTPQYEGLEALYGKFAGRGFSILGFPCNQFAGQEPGSAEEIREFCSLTYGVTFPLFEKVDVKGPERHPLFAELTEVPDAEGKAGDVLWNFEKFLIAPAAASIVRFRTLVTPEDEALVAAIEQSLP